VLVDAARLMPAPCSAAACRRHRFNSGPSASARARPRCTETGRRPPSPCAAGNMPEGASAADVEGWSTDQVLTFLDKLGQLRSLQPLHASTAEVGPGSARLGSARQRQRQRRPRLLLAAQGRCAPLATRRPQQRPHTRYCCYAATARPCPQPLAPPAAGAGAAVQPVRHPQRGDPLCLLQALHPRGGRQRAGAVRGPAEDAGARGARGRGRGEQAGQAARFRLARSS
jgi:hypothetical protein